MATVRLDEADHHIGAAVLAAHAFTEHPVGLADAGRGTEVDAQCSACHGPSPWWLSHSGRQVVERQVELDDVDARLAKHPELTPVGVLVDQLGDDCDVEAAVSATRAVWIRALAIEMCGSRPEPDAVTASTGTRASAASPFSSR